MNPFLLPALKARLQVDLADLYLEYRISSPEDGEELSRPVQIYIGDLPPKKRRTGSTGTLDEYFPCIVLVPASGQWDHGEDIATVAVIYGVFCAEDGDAEGAEMDLAVLLSRIKQSLYLSHKQPLHERYKLVEDSKGRLFPWEKSDLQARPYIQGTLMTHWRMKGLE